MEIPERMSTRIAWVDLAKAYGIGFVFYGHFAEKLKDLGNPIAFWQFKLIYSFHIPLFFILAGYVSKNSNADFPDFLKQGFMGRIVPALFFNLLVMTISIFRDLLLRSLDPTTYIIGVLQFAKGYPSFNVVTWFLICLFTVEIIHFLMRRYIVTNSRLFISAVAFLCIGWTIAWQMEFITSVTGITKDFWYVHEAILGYSLYQIGVLLKNLRIFEARVPLVLRFASLCLLAPSVLFTFGLNDGPFISAPVVNMSNSSHGNLLLFSFTAMAGSLFVMILAQLTPVNKPMLFIGQYSLIFMGLNGLLISFVNERLSIWVHGFLPNAQLAIFGACAWVTVSSLAVCTPAVLVLAKYFPLWVGRKRESRSLPIRDLKLSGEPHP